VFFFNFDAHFCVWFYGLSLVGILWNLALMNKEIDLDAEPAKKTAAQRYHELTYTPSMSVEEREKARRSEEWDSILCVVMASSVRCPSRSIASLSIPTAILIILFGLFKQGNWEGMLLLALCVMTIGFLLLSQELFEVTKKAESEERKAAYLRNLESIAAQAKREREEE
jgi:hypothetical protein